MSGIVLSIEATARLEPEPDAEIAKARERAEAGDADWAQWLEEYNDGAALLIWTEVVVRFKTPDGREETIRMENHGLWIEDHAHPPKVAQQVAELSHRDFPEISHELSRRGLDVAEADLSHMFINAQLADEVVGSLSGATRHPRQGIDSDTGLT